MIERPSSCLWLVLLEHGSGGRWLAFQPQDTGLCACIFQCMPGAMRLMSSMLQTLQLQKCVALLTGLSQMSVPPWSHPDCICQAAATSAFLLPHMTQEPESWQGSSAPLMQLVSPPPPPPPHPFVPHASTGALWYKRTVVNVAALKQILSQAHSPGGRPAKTAVGLLLQSGCGEGRRGSPLDLPVSTRHHLHHIPSSFKVGGLSTLGTCLFQADFQILLAHL